MPRRELRDLPFGDDALERTVSIPIDHVTLEGTLGVPERAIGVVLFAHGSGSSRFSPRNRFVARVLRDAGLGTLLLDLLSPSEEEVDDLTGHHRFDIPMLAGRLVWRSTGSVVRRTRRISPSDCSAPAPEVVRRSWRRRNVRGALAPWSRAAAVRILPRRHCRSSWPPRSFWSADAMPS